MVELAQLLLKFNFTISLCESLTGGLASKVFSDYPGASKYFLGSIVSYSNEVKTGLVKVNKLTINDFGSISEQCAFEMAKNTQSIFKSDVAVSFTGNAGPKTIEDKEVGLVYIGICILDHIFVEKLNFKGNRKEIREQSLQYAIKLLKIKLNNFKKESLY